MEESKFSKQKFIQQMSNCFLFLHDKDKQIRRSHFYYVITLIVLFWQLLGILTFSVTPFKNDVLLEIFQQISKYIIVTPLMSEFDSDIMGFVVTLIFLIADWYFLYSYYILRNSSTKIIDNNQEYLSINISFMHRYSELLKFYIIQIKLDVMLGIFFCNDLYTDEQGNFTTLEYQNRCIQNLNYRYIPSFIMIPIGILLAVYTVFIIFFSALAFTQIDFRITNLIKPNYTPEVFLEYFLFFVLALSSYPQVMQKEICFIISGILGIFYLQDYIRHFPVVGFKISHIYFSCIQLYLVSIIMYSIKEYNPDILDESNFIFTFLVTCSIFIVFSVALTRRIYINSLFIQDFEKNIQQTTFLLQQMDNLFLESEQKAESWTILMGILEVHQVMCEDILCPCKDGAKSAKGWKNKIKNNVQGKAVIREGVYFPYLAQNRQSFTAWIEDFTEYTFLKVLDAIQNKKTGTQKTNIVYFNFWNFEIYGMKNFVKCLYLLKQHYQNNLEAKTQETYFMVIETVVTRQIENIIRQNDKSLEYSSKLQDVQDAQVIKDFGNLVINEFILYDIKSQLIKILTFKKDIFQKLIKGYECYNTFQQDLLSLVSQSDEIQKKIQNNLILSGDNVHYFKMIQILKLVIFNDPLSLTENDRKLQDMLIQDSNKDTGLVHSITILEGKVTSLVMSYKDHTCKLMGYSKNCPDFFGYESQEFSQLSNVNVIVPDCLAVYHDSLVGRLIKEGDQHILRKYRNIVAKEKRGYIFPIKIYVDYYFHYHDLLCFSGTILKLVNSCQYIIVSQDGWVQGISEGLQEQFKELGGCEDIDYELLMQMNIKAIFPTLLEFLQDYDKNEITGNMNNIFPMVLPKRMNDYLIELVHQKHNFMELKAENFFQDKVLFAQKLMFYLFKSSQHLFEEHTNVLDVHIRITKEVLTVDHNACKRTLQLYILELNQMTQIDEFYNKQENKGFFQDELENIQNIQKSNQASNPFDQVSTNRGFDVQFPQIELKYSKKFEQMNMKTILILKNQLEHQMTKKLLNTDQDQSDSSKLDEQYLKEQVQDLPKNEQKYIQQDLEEIMKENNYTDIIKWLKKKIELEDLKNHKEDSGNLLLPSPNGFPEKDETKEVAQNFKESSMKSQSVYSKVLTIGTVLTQKTAKTKRSVQEVRSKIKTLNTLSKMTKGSGVGTIGMDNVQNDLKNDKRQIFRSKRDIAEMKRQESKQEDQELEEKLKLPQSIAIRREMNYQTQDEKELQQSGLAISELDVPDIEQEEMKRLQEQKEMLAKLTEEQRQFFQEDQQEIYEYEQYLASANYLDLVKQMLQVHTNYETSYYDKSMMKSQRSAKNKALPSQRYQTRSFDPYGIQNKKDSDSESSSGDNESSFEQDFKKQDEQKGMIDKTIQIISTNLKQITNLVYQKAVPEFVMSLYVLFTVQLVFYSLSIILTVLNTNNVLTDLDKTLVVIDYNTRYMSSISKASISCNNLFLLNEILPSFNYKQPSTLDNYKEFLLDSIDQSYEFFNDALSEQLSIFLQYPQQEEFQNYQLEAVFWDYSHEHFLYNQNFKLPEILKLIQEELYNLSLQDSINENNYPFILNTNLIYLNKAFKEIDEGVFKSVNLKTSTISILLLVFSLLIILFINILIYRGIVTIKDKQYKQISLIGRITQEESIYELQKIYCTIQLLQTDTCDYLHQNFAKADNLLTKFKDSYEMNFTTKVKGQSKQTHMSERIQIQRISYFWHYLMLSIICILQFLTIILGFTLSNNFISNFKEPVENNYEFLKALQDYSILIQTHNLELVQNILDTTFVENNNKLFTEAQLNDLLSLKQQANIDVNKYFTYNYHKVSNTQQTEDFRKDILKINSEDNCSGEYFTSLERSSCHSSLEGLVDRGFQNSLTYLRNIIMTRDETNLKTKEDYIDYMKSSKYIQQIQAEILSQKIMQQIMDIFVKDNESILQYNNDLVLLIYSSMTGAYLVMWIVKLLYFYYTLLKNIPNLRRALLFMPYNKLSEDNNTIMLVKNIYTLD